MITDTITKTTDTEMETYQSSKDKGETPHDYLKDCVDEFITVTNDARLLSERCRDYYDGKQWTAEQIAALKKRKQSPIVNNRIKVKQNGLLGLTSVRQGDPKAFPRNVDYDSDAAEAVTDGLRYAADRVLLNTTFLNCADNFFCEGYTAVNVVEEYMPDGSVEVAVDHIPWDRIFYDPFSRRHDFDDCRYKGFGIWMDEEDIRNAFEDAEEDAFQIKETTHDETFEDRPAWHQKHGKRKRHLVITHYYKENGEWMLAIYTAGGMLMQPVQSPYLDEYGRPECPIEIEHAYVDRENNRYGELASFLDLQDEINHRRSKALFLLSQRQTYGNRGAVKDVKKSKRELAKPDGHLEVGQGEYGKDFGILPTGDMAQGQFEMLQEAKGEIDAQSYSAQLAGERQQGDLSGVAIQRLQNSGVTELIKIFENFSAFKLRVYRKMWNRIRQYWTEEKWVRVTDDEDKLKFVGFNVSMTMGAYLQEIMDDDSKPREMRLGASAQLIQLERTNPEALEQVVEVRNPPAELVMDIVLDESYDTVNVSQEQLDAILKFGAQGQFDIVDLLELSNITNKDRLIEKIENRRKEQAEAAAQQGQDPQLQFLQGKAKEAEARAVKTMKEAEQKDIENAALQGGQIPFKGSVTI
jgi:hypothetical protein